MGVKGLWQLLLPIGRKINIETLERKVLAVDASIWLTQFIKAMRDDEGKLIRNAHLIGTIRRITKLLFHKIIPVFVFDGGTPILKLKTLQKRQQLRQRHEVGLRKTAQRILMKELKKKKAILKNAMILKECEDTQAAESPKSTSFVEGFNPVEQIRKEHVKNMSSEKFEMLNEQNQKLGTEHIVCKQDLIQNGESPSKHAIEIDCDSAEEVQWVKGIELKNQADDGAWMHGSSNEGSDWEGDVELPADEDKLDIDMLNALPGHLKMDVINSTKRNCRIKARQAYLPVAGDPLLYSQTQIANFLKSSRLNSKIMEMGKCEKGGDSAMEGRSIASDSSRKFIMMKAAPSPEKKEDRYSFKVNVPLQGVIAMPNKTTYVHTLSEDEGTLEEFGGFLQSHPSSPASRPLSTSNIPDKPSTNWIQAKPSGGFIGSCAAAESALTSGRRSEDLKMNDELDIAQHQMQGRVFSTDTQRALGIAGWGGDSSPEPNHTPQVTNQKSPNCKKVTSAETARALAVAGWSDSDDEDITTAVHKQEAKHPIPVAHKQEEAKHPILSQMEKDEQLAKKLQAEENSKSASPQNFSSTPVSSPASTSQQKRKTETLVVVPDCTTDYYSGQVVGGNNGEAKGLPAAAQNYTGEDLNPIVISVDLEQIDSSNLFPASLFGHNLHQDLVGESSHIFELSSSEDDGGVAWSRGDSSPQKIPQHLSASIQYSSDSDIEVVNNLKNSYNCKDPLEFFGSEQKQVLQRSRISNEEALQQAVQGASKLADWAGRAVSRAVRQHIGGGIGTLPVSSRTVMDTQAPRAVEAQDKQIATRDNTDTNLRSPETLKKPPVSPISAQLKGSPPKQTQQKSTSETPTKQLVFGTPSKSLPNKTTGRYEQFSKVQSPIQTQEENNQKKVELCFEKVDSSAPETDDELEATKLKQQKKKHMRDSETVTEEMKEEVMELLQLFGVPYIVSPMEAEAQCAELERLGLVEGVITDDSDAFLFGASRVYKNIFEDKKFVEAYLTRDAELELGIGRYDMIALALMLGSDYTEGVRGVGIVNAMEILEAFPVQNDPKSSLLKFKEWLDGFDPIADTLDIASETLSKFHRKHRNARNRWVVNEDFPSSKIIQAYTHPTVNSSTDKFSQESLDVEGIREFCQTKMGWPAFKTDELIGPVMEKLTSPIRQTRIDQFFVSYHDNVTFARIKSKRLQMAVADLREAEHDKSYQHASSSKKMASKEDKKLIASKQKHPKKRLNSKIETTAQVQITTPCRAGRKKCKSALPKT